MKIIHFSDTHNCHHRLRDLPEADVVVHSGDFCMVGTEQEAIDFLNWFCDLPYKHKIFICGNHDECLYGANIEGMDSNVHFLCNSGIEIEGVKFYGIPMFLSDCITERQNQNYANIPDDTDVLITHSPAYGILDFDDNIHYGSEELLEKISTLNLKAHLFGHIHAKHGIITLSDTIYSNGAIMNSQYTTFNHPNILELNNL
ncbi:serine/threonine protein phosphatase [Muribaculaceae bacterium Isolate-105 (HZI)]|nr:serine/threonine protein phosphatase [Muribaculaceae bacterium Isolate-105 (HZI)]